MSGRNSLWAFVWALCSLWATAALAVESSLAGNSSSDFAPASGLLLAQAAPSGNAPDGKEPDNATDSKAASDQKAQLAERDRFWKECQAARDASDWDKALTAGARALAIERKYLGGEHVDTLDSIRNVAEIYEAKENFAAARPLRNEWLATKTKLYGKDDYRTIDARLALAHLGVMEKLAPAARQQLAEADKLADQGSADYDAGHYAKAVDAAEKVLAIREKILGRNDPGYVVALGQLATYSSSNGNYPKAVQLDKQFVDLRKAIFGANHPYYAIALNNLATVYDSMGQYAKAIALDEQSLEVFKAAYGEESDDYSNTLDNMAAVYEKMGDYVKAEPLYKRALEIRKIVLGENDHVYANNLNDLASLYVKMGNYTEAEKLFNQALEILKKGPGEDNLDYATALDDLGWLYEHMGLYAKAEPLYVQSMKIRKEFLGDKHPTYAQCLDDLGALYMEMADFAKSEKLYTEALAIRRSTLGENHPDVADSLNNLANLYDRMGNYAKAEEYFKKSLEIHRAAEGEKHPSFASSLDNLAWIYDEMGEYAKAEPLYIQAMNIRKELLGENHPDFASSLNDLAEFYNKMGNYAKAEPYYKQSMAIRKKALGEKHPSYATSLSDLAGLYVKMGDYSDAEPLYLQAIDIRKEVLGPKHPDYADTLDNLAWLYRCQGDYDKAEPLYKEALDVRKASLGEKHADYAASLSDLAELYDNLHEYEKSEPLYKQALEIYKATLGVKHPTYATTLNNLARLYDDTGEYAKAEKCFLEALQIQKAAFGEKHPSYAISISNLSMLYADMGQFDKAVPLAHQSIDIMRSQLDMSSSVQSERQQLKMASSLRGYLDDYLSVAQLANVPSEQVYAQVLAWKGSVSAWQRTMRRLRLSGDNPKAVEISKQLAETARQFDSLSRATPLPAKADEHQRDLKALNDKLESLEKQLSAVSADFRRELDAHKRTPVDLQRVMPANTALVDFLEYWHYEPPHAKGEKPEWEQRIAAFVVNQQQPIVRVELGSSESIGKLVDDWRKSYSAADGAELRKAIWQPIEEKLTGATTILVSPDGPLDRLPFAALPGKKDGTYLIEDVAVGTIPIPRMLPEMLAGENLSPRAAVGAGFAGTENKSRTGTASGTQEVPSLLTVGEVDFKAALAAPPQRTLVAMAAPAANSTIRGGAAWQFKPLDGTRAEIVAINDSFEQRFPDGKRKSLRKDKATKQAVCDAMPQFTFLHLATHGFFAPPELRSALVDAGSAGAAQNGESGGQSRAGSIDITGYQPDLLTGLALAGANQRPQPGQDDGILTALAVEELDLSRVQLATLSACETGLGETAGGEGVLGLQCAFQLAGARSTVATLWKIPDKASQLLMTDFYENLWDESKHLTRLEALRQAQLKMLREGANRGLELPDDQPGNKPDQIGRMPPFYWAAFELSGDWR